MTLDETTADPFAALDQARLLLAMCVARGADTVDALASLAGVDPTDLDEDVQGLVRADLVTRDGAGRCRVNRNRWHELAQQLDRVASASSRSDMPASLPPALRKVPYFAQLGADELAQLVPSLRQQRHAAGDMVITEGQSSPGLFVVQSGHVRVFTTAASGRQQVLRVMGAGESLNEVPAFDGGPNPASVEAVEPAVLLLVPQDALDALLINSPRFARGMVRMLANRLRHMVALVEDLSFRQVTARIAKVLLQATAPAPGVGAGVEEIRALSQRDIADLAGTAREVVARSLHGMEREGLVRLDRGRVVVADAERLRALADGG